MKNNGISFNPEPCEPECVFTSFGEDALLWYGIFCQTVERWTDEKTKKDRHNIRFDALQYVCEAYDLDKKQAYEWVRYIISAMSKTIELDKAVILGFKPIDINYVLDL